MDAAVELAGGKVALQERNNALMSRLTEIMGESELGPPLPHSDGATAVLMAASAVFGGIGFDMLESKDDPDAHPCCGEHGQALVGLAYAVLKETFRMTVAATLAQKYPGVTMEKVALLAGIGAGQGDDDGA